MRIPLCWTRFENEISILKAVTLAAVLLAIKIPVTAQTWNLVKSRVTANTEFRGFFPADGIQHSDLAEQQNPERSAPDQQSWGNISGTIIDQTGAVSVGADVQLTRDDQSSKQEVLSGANGQFSFDHVASGPFRLTITSVGFSTHVFSGVLRPGQTYIVPPIMLAVATAVTKVEVGLTQVEVAQAQVKEQEKQRVLGFIPNFFVSYVPNAAPLSPKLKFQLAWKSSIDPITFLGNAALAGIAQAGDGFSGYGQGAQGYAKRFGASYADDFIGTFLGSAAFPSLLKQDPRYFYKGKGSFRSRLLYALSNSVICKGDNGRRQPNYSAILGGMAAGGISYLYYPASDRNGAGLFFANTLIKTGEDSIAAVFQEFVIPRFTPHVRQRKPAQP